VKGRVLVIAIVGSALLAGVAMYYLQVHAYYRELPAQTQVTMTRTDGMEVQMEVTDFRGIDADSSPIRYRACFTAASVPADLTPYEGAEPLTTPGWFDCYDAPALGAALAEGTARAFLGQSNITWGIDRIVALMPDGRGYSWHQINACGREVFDGRPAPEGCPPPPEKE
jgi:hypothetical protein